MIRSEQLNDLIKCIFQFKFRDCNKYSATTPSITGNQSVKTYCRHYFSPLDLSSSKPVANQSYVSGYNSNRHSGKKKIPTKAKQSLNFKKFNPFFKLQEENRPFSKKKPSLRQKVVNPRGA